MSDVAMTWTLQRDAFGRLLLTLADASVHVGVVPVRAFPLAAPLEALSLMSTEGHELVFVDHWNALDADTRALLADELAAREFAPLIERLVAVSTFSTPSIWDVETDRGATRFTLKGEDDIRRLPDRSLLIADSHGVMYRIAAPAALDRASRRLLDRFL